MMAMLGVSRSPTRSGSQQMYRRRVVSRDLDIPPNAVCSALAMIYSWKDSKETSNSPKNPNRIR